jgi:hypothetical protein
MNLKQKIITGLREREKRKEKYGPCPIEVHMFAKSHLEIIIKYNIVAIIIEFFLKTPLMVDTVF